MAVSPDGKWIASAGKDNTIVLWPVPNWNERPLQALPYEELLRKLRTLTNFRAIEDDDSPTGYRIEAGPFPGWKTVPTW